MRLWAQARRRLERDGAMFGLRLLCSVALVLGLVGVSGYLVLQRELTHSEVASHAATQRADAQSFEAVAAASPDGATAVARVDDLVDAIARRPGTLETLLVDGNGVVRAAGDDSLVGTTDRDERIDAALAHGQSYAGREGDPGLDGRDFEFVAPVRLAGRPYAFEVSYDHSAFDSRMNAVRAILVLLGALALALGGGVFYLVGGRALVRSHREALRRATRDGLTDLPNHRAFQDEFPAAVATAHRHQGSLALVAIDIDDLKFINDRHGHPVGDSLLRQLTGVLLDGRAGDRVYRVGGDEFVAVLTHTDADGVRVFARRLHRRASEAKVSISMGASLLRPGQPADDLRAEADAALYEAKHRGGNAVIHFEDVKDRIAVTTVDRRAALSALLSEQRLTTVFQPIWGLEAGTLIGVEALTRPDPSYGFAGAAEAFDVAERVSRVHELDALCVERALEAMPTLPGHELVFLNIRPQTLDLDAEGNDWLRAAVKRAGFAPQRVVIEVTERFDGRTSSIVKCLDRLRSQGFQVALDDVGTGSAGLEILSKVNPEFVKIDSGIVTAAVTDPAARAVLLAVATYARQTDTFVIAEGVEDRDTLDLLRRIADGELTPDRVIQGGQGFGLGEPAEQPSYEPAIPLGRFPRAA